MQNIALAGAIPASPISLEIALPIPAKGPVQSPASDGSAGITAEIIIVIETAVAAFAGKTARIISVKLVDEAPARPNSWVDQGLALVHRSHNTVQRGHK
jgi:hypothetical protein